MEIFLVHSVPAQLPLTQPSGCPFSGCTGCALHNSMGYRLQSHHKFVYLVQQLPRKQQSALNKE